MGRRLHSRRKTALQMKSPTKRRGCVVYLESKMRYSCWPMNISRNWNMFRKLM